MSDNPIDPSPPVKRDGRVNADREPLEQADLARMLKIYRALTSQVELSPAPLRFWVRVASEASLLAQYALHGLETPRLPSTLLLDVLMKPVDAADASANLEEVYPLWVAKHGARTARWIFRVQAAAVVAGYWWARVLGQAERVAKVVKVFVSTGSS